MPSLVVIDALTMKPTAEIPVVGRDAESILNDVKSAPIKSIDDDYMPDCNLGLKPEAFQQKYMSLKKDVEMFSEDDLIHFLVMAQMEKDKLEKENEKLKSENERIIREWTLWHLRHAESMKDEEKAKGYLRDVVQPTLNDLLGMTGDVQITFD